MLKRKNETDKAMINVEDIKSIILHPMSVQLVDWTDGTATMLLAVGGYTYRIDGTYEITKSKNSKVDS